MFHTVEESGCVTIRYDSAYLTCGKKLTGSQLSPPHGINRKLKCETKNKMMSVISPVKIYYIKYVIFPLFGGKPPLGRFDPKVAWWVASAT